MRFPVTALGHARAFAMLVAAMAAVPAAVAAAPARIDAAALYETKCQNCHGPKGEAAQKGAGLSFADGEWRHGKDLKTIAAVIADGVPGTAMKRFKEQLTAREIQALARYVRSLDKTSSK